MAHRPLRTGKNGSTAHALALLSTIALLLTSCSSNGAEETGGRVEDGATDSNEAGPPDLGEPQDLVTDLEVPWGIDFLPDGSALVAQRDSAEVVLVAPDGTTSGAGTVEGVSHGGEGGLLGLALDPDFPEEPYAYAYFTSDSDNRVARIRYDEEAGELGEAEVILEGIPAADTHNGGRIAFGPDGHLYVATGDAQNPDDAQDTDSLAGKILRMTTSGEPAPGNPFDDHVYSYGHRNVQGLAWDGEGDLYATEFGADALDEINLIEAGDNYGWPITEGPGGGEEYTDPLITWEPAEASPSGMAIAGDSLWVASLRGARLWEVPLIGEGEVGEPRAHFVDEFGRLRTVLAHPEGDALWLSTSNHDAWGSPNDGDDRLMRIPLE
ncbi:PQQ-dependent sugar dehydrogenase [Nocardiopsis alkaliphila]|uniref:PQQ-dependent sugar dehydrogenase n=1 Tax=Nocardiopsis alkaliphila TaxID=225762 RepID=UPI0003465EBD|nr:PQQ-dependent sugar dehydrogenase [Nocardiopsis alkaliphila]